MMVSSRIQVGIIGTGMIAEAHARAAVLNDARVVGVAGSSRSKAEAALQRLRADRAFDSPEQLIADPAIEAVHICTPNHLHAPFADMALRAGKHVVCEKPLAMNADQARRLRDVARKSGLIAAVPFVYRYYAMAQLAREIVTSGQLGREFLAHGHYLQDWLLSERDFNWRVRSDAGGASRAFADIGSHWFDLVQFVSGQQVARVNARSSIVHPQRVAANEAHSFHRGSEDGEPFHVQTEDAMLVQFEFESGTLGTMMVSQVSAGSKNRLEFEIDLAEGSLAFSQEHPNSLRISRRDGSTEIERDPGTLSDSSARVTHLPAGHPEGYERCFEALLADVYKGVRFGTGNTLLPTFEDGLRSMELTDAVLESASSQKWVEVPRG